MRGTTFCPTWTSRTKARSLKQEHNHWGVLILKRKRRHRGRGSAEKFVVNICTGCHHCGPPTPASNWELGVVVASMCLSIHSTVPQSAKRGPACTKQMKHACSIQKKQLVCTHSWRQCVVCFWLSEVWNKRLVFFWFGL